MYDFIANVHLENAYCMRRPGVWDDKPLSRVSVLNCYLRFIIWMQLLFQKPTFLDLFYLNNLHSSFHPLVLSSLKQKAWHSQQWIWENALGLHNRSAHQHWFWPIISPALTFPIAEGLLFPESLITEWVEFALGGPHILAQTVIRRSQRLDGLNNITVVGS